MPPGNLNLFIGIVSGLQCDDSRERSDECTTERITRGIKKNLK